MTISPTAKKEEATVETKPAPFISGSEALAKSESNKDSATPVAANESEKKSETEASLVKSDA